MNEPLDDSLENQLVPELDDAGNMTGGTMSRSDADHVGFMRLLRLAAERFPLDDADIVLPTFATITTEVRDANGNVVASIRTADIPLSHKPTR